MEAWAALKLSLYKDELTFRPGSMEATIAASRRLKLSGAFQSTGMMAKVLSEYI